MTYRRAAVRHASAPLAAIALAMSVTAMSVTAIFAQGFPAPPPSQSPAGPSPFPAVNGAAPAVSFGTPGAFPSGGAPPVGGAPMGAPPPGPGAAAGNDCERGFLPLRSDAEKRGQAIKAAGERRAPPDEACKLIGAFSSAEIKMIKFVENNAQKCGIPPQVADQLKTGHKNTDAMMKKVCAVAQQVQQRAPAGPSLSEVLGSSNALPEATPAKRNGGSTFDTLNGNVLTR